MIKGKWSWMAIVFAGTVAWGCATTSGTPDQPMDESEVEVGEEKDLWLEEISSDEALAWVRGQNERSLLVLEEQGVFESLRTAALEILTSEDSIAYPALRGGMVYNFWRDANHVRGIWRITTREEYRKERPEWELLLDIDALAEEEGENWVWGGSRCRHPDYDRCLVSLSIGGADASVRREFDLSTREFVEDGFFLEESKSFLSWRDLDSTFYAPAFEAEEMTTSEYPRRVYIWERGTPKEEARLIFEAPKEDVLVSGFRIWDGDDAYDMIMRMPTFFTNEYYLLDEEEELVRIVIPDDARITAIIQGQLLVELKSDWEVGGRSYLQGALLAASMDSVLEESPDFEVLFQPGPRQSLNYVAATETTVLVGVLDNVVGSLLRFTYEDGEWERTELSVPELGTVRVVATDDGSDQFYYFYTGFLTPTTLFEAHARDDEHREIRSEPVWFNKEGMEVVQHEATSADGEKIPYFVVTPQGFEANGQNPTLLGGYGGFEVSRTPFYAGVMGRNWLERGGVYVMANIRGGGEFGPRWHQAALRENRQRAFDDFIAVAEDLIERGITSPEHLGIMGGSNGGLLVGAVMVQRPELFGAVVSQVPLLDMKRYHRLLAGASWMAEYGNPDDPEDWAFLEKYSPYQNLAEEAAYPVVFITTSTRDDRVHPGHARRMVAKMLRQGHEVLYYENIEGGHGGAANQEQRAFISALTYAYLHMRLFPEGAGEAAEGTVREDEEGQ